LATTASGGNVQNANGYDIIFASDSGCATQLNHEVESYNAATGAVNYWVRVATVSHTSDTRIYMCYGNASITIDQTNKTSVWNNFNAVWHMGNGSTLNLSDSTANGNDLVNAGTTALAGKVAGGSNFSGTQGLWRRLSISR